MLPVRRRWRAWFQVAFMPVFLLLLYQNRSGCKLLRAPEVPGCMATTGKIAAETLAFWNIIPPKKLSVTAGSSPSKSQIYVNENKQILNLLSCRDSIHPDSQNGS
jgi:hypothetical protein